MIDFIISKFGIMMFAVAVAGIMIGFMGGMKDIFTAEEGLKLSGIISNQMKEISDSDNLCTTTYVQLPRFIDVIGGTTAPTTNSVRYFLNIKQSEPIDGSENKFVVFEVQDKRSKEVISIDSFITDAEVRFETEELGSDEDSENVTKIIKDESNNYLQIDPTYSDIVFLIKYYFANNEEAIKELIFVTCRYKRNANDPMSNCYTKLQTIANDNENGIIYCVPGSDTSVVN